MLVYQWVYTYSCWNRKKDGERSIRGFNTFSYSKGLTPAEIAELERRCSYNPPFGLPAQPNSNEIAALFPISFHSFTLASGRKVLVRSNYIGKGFYDGRWGSFISHGLILDSGDWPHYSMEYFDADVFWRDLPEEIKAKALTVDPAGPNSIEPELLPTLSEKEVCPTSNFSPEKVRQYSEQNIGKNQLAFLIDKLMTTPSAQKPLVISTQWQEIPWYFAAVTMAFPLHIANSISFVTYLDVPKPSMNTIENWYWLVGAEQRKANIHFNEADNIQPESDFLDAVFLNREAFYEFLASLGNIQIEKFPLAATCFLTLQKKGFAPPEKELLSLLNFILDIGDRNLLKMFLQHLSQCGNAQISLTGITVLYATVPDDDSLLSLVDEFVINQLKYSELEFAGKVFSEIDKQNRETFYKNCLRCINPDAISNLTELSMLLVALAKEGKTADQVLISSIKVPADSADNSNAWDVLLSIVASSAIAAFPIALHLCPVQLAVQKSCTELLKDMNKFFLVADSVLASGFEKDAAEMLILGNTLNSHNDSFFVQCISELFIKYENFTRKNLLDILDKIQLKHISKSSLEKYAELYGILDEVDAGKYLEKLSCLLPIPEKADSHYGTNLKRIVDAGKNKSLNLRRAEFILWGMEIEQNNIKAFDKIGTMNEIALLFPTSDKSAVVDWLLPCLFQYGTDAEFHHQSLMFLASLMDPSIVARRYVKLAQKAAEKKKAGILEPRVLALVVCVIKLIPPGGLLSELLTELSFTVFNGYEISAFDALRNQISPLTILNAEEQSTWMQLREKIFKNSKAGFLKRTFVKMIRLFKRR